MPCAGAKHSIQSFGPLIPQSLNNEAKAQALRRHKAIATGLFLLMVVLYIITRWAMHGAHTGVLPAVNAFSEAAMVGALADWFAVTALFYHPLGIPIPHTNLIEKGKQRIGDNLGGFVVGNFLTPANLRPYLDKFFPSKMLAGFLQQKKYQELIITEASTLLRDILERTDDRAAASFLAKQGAKLLDGLHLSSLISSGVRYAVEAGEHQAAITMIAGRIKKYIVEQEDLVRERVKSESYFFVPGFVNNKLADKITTALAKYFSEIEEDPQHRLREEISRELLKWTEQLQNDPTWEAKFQNIRSGLLSPEKLEEYTGAAWSSFKVKLLEELQSPDSSLLQYLSKALDEGVRRLHEDMALQEKIDTWVRFQAYSAVLRYKDKASALISTTIGNWPARELSHKLELEVGKDLQYIRINGTVVGGLVGLVIHLLTEWLG